MMADWNPWLALLLGVALGWLLMWLLDMLFFRRRHVEMSAQLADATAEAKALSAEMEGLRQQNQALRTDLDRHLAAAAVVLALPPPMAVAAPAAGVESLGLGLAGVATAAFLADADAAAPHNDEVSLAAPEVVAVAPALEATAPEAGLRTVAVQASLPEVTEE